ncbi:hypothetical protein [Nitrosovibrio sp. Nv4]|uniref:hypothetical protein n=1 Tax=Nitrosovibrio sp. Nv4 TaxID=1945880 RepID=UPI001F1AAC06|nr:hypothetical protein [Nitrosovibrio sp. Nv4]
MTWSMPVPEATPPGAAVCATELAGNAQAKASPGTRKRLGFASKFLGRDETLIEQNVLIGIMDFYA